MKIVQIHGIDIHVDDDARQIKINDITQDSATSAWDDISSAFAGFSALFCFTDTLAPIAFLNNIGAAEFKNCLIMRLHPRDFVNMPPHDGTAPDVVARVSQIAADARAAFAANPDTRPEVFVPHGDYLAMGAALHVGFVRAGYFISYRVDKI